MKVLLVLTVIAGTLLVAKDSYALGSNQRSPQVFDSSQKYLETNQAVMPCGAIATFGGPLGAQKALYFRKLWTTTNPESGK